MRKSYCAAVVLVLEHLFGHGDLEDLLDLETEGGDSLRGLDLDGLSAFLCVVHQDPDDYPHF